MKQLSAILAAALIVVLSGFTATTYDPAKTSLQQSILVFIQSNCPSGENPTLIACYHARAQTVTQIVGTVEAIAKQPKATLASVHAIADSAIANARIEDVPALRVLLKQAVAIIDQKIGQHGTGALTKPQRAVIASVGAWVTDVSENYPLSAPVTNHGEGLRDSAGKPIMNVVPARSP